MERPNLELLEQFGLNRNDIKIYNALHSIGRSKTGPIIKETNIVSSRVYESLRNLVKKGLVSYEVKNNIKYYQAELPEQLIEEAEQNVRGLRTLSKDLSSSPIIPTSRNETNTYEGIRGFKMAYEQHVDELEQGERVSIIAFVGKEYQASRSIRNFFSEVVDTTMIKKKSRGRMITSKPIKEIIKKDRPDSSIYDIRHLPTPYALPYAINISKREVMLSVWGDEPIVFKIRNPIIVASFQANFNHLWDIAKK